MCESKSSQNNKDLEFIYIQIRFYTLGVFPQLNSPFAGRKNGRSEGNLLICLQVSTVCVFDRQNMLAEALNTSRTLFTWRYFCWRYKKPVSVCRSRMVRNTDGPKALSRKCKTIVYCAACAVSSSVSCLRLQSSSLCHYAWLFIEWHNTPVGQNVFFYARSCVSIMKMPFIPS